MDYFPTEISYSPKVLYSLSKNSIAKNVLFTPYKVFIYSLKSDMDSFLA